MPGLSLYPAVKIADKNATVTPMIIRSFMYVSLPFVGFVHINFIIAYKFETVKEWHDFLLV